MVFKTILSFSLSYSRFLVLTYHNMILSFTENGEVPLIS